MAEEVRRGHKIEIRENAKPLAGSPRTASGNSLAHSPDAELVIDGEHVPYLKTDDGFVIYYGPPAKSLMEAARTYVDSQRAK